MEYVLVLADIIKAIDPNKVVRDAYRLARYKYDKDKLDNYKSACLCNIEIPSNEQVHVLELSSSMALRSRSIRATRPAFHKVHRSSSGPSKT